LSFNSLSLDIMEMHTISHPRRNIYPGFAR